MEGLAVRAPSKSFVTHCFLMCPEAFIILYPDEYVKENSGGYRPRRENMVLCIIIMMLEPILPQSWVGSNLAKTPEKDRSVLRPR